jgi:hypothetical protein
MALASVIRRRDSLQSSRQLRLTAAVASYDETSLQCGESNVR